MHRHVTTTEFRNMVHAGSIVDGATLAACAMLILRTS